jgi:hypothetical protein
LRKLDDIPGAFRRLELVAGPLTVAEKVVLKAEVSMLAVLKALDGGAVDVGA